MGQGARLIRDGDNVIQNVFFQSIPGGVNGGFWWFTFVLAILAAVIASQGLSPLQFRLQYFYEFELTSFLVLDQFSYDLSYFLFNSTID